MTLNSLELLTENPTTLVVGGSEKGIKMEQKQNNTQTQEVVSYSKDKIQLLFNILNSMSFIGIQQAQAIEQISVIRGQPIQNETNKDSKNDELK